jgi:iron complex outermembrane receptor protein
VGFKGRLFDGMADYQADVYLIHWNNMQIQETTADAAFVYQGNAGTAEVKGAELELNLHPIQYLTVSLAGSYQDAYLTQGASAAQYALNPTLGLTGNRIPNVPPVQLSFGVRYLRPIADNWQGTFGTDVTYRGAENSYFASNSFNLPLSSYTLVKMWLGVINGPWSGSVFVRNLTNERAQVSAINSTQDPDALLTVQPRTIGLTVTRKF